LLLDLTGQSQSCVLPVLADLARGQGLADPALRSGQGLARGQGLADPVLRSASPGVFGQRVLLTCEAFSILFHRIVLKKSWIIWLTWAGLSSATRWVESGTV